MGSAIVLAVTASLFIGLGEFSAARAISAQRSETVTTTFFLVGIAVAAIAALFLDGSWVMSDMMIGAASGVLNGIGLVLLYRAYAAVPIGVAAPIAATVFAVVPVIFGVVFRDGSVNTWIGLGLVLGLIAVALASFDPQPTGALRSGVALALGAGSIYGGALILLGEISEDSGALSLIPQRALGLLAALAAARATGPNLFPLRGRRSGPALVGLFGSLGALFFLLAAQRGDIGPVSVLGSQFAAVAVALGFIVNGDRLRWWQTVGLLCAAGAVSFMALG